MPKNNKHDQGHQQEPPHSTKALPRPCRGSQVTKSTLTRREGGKGQTKPHCRDRAEFLWVLAVLPPPRGRGAACQAAHTPRAPSTPSSSACVCHCTPRLPHPKSFLFDVASFNLTNPKHKLLLQQASRPISIKCFAQSLLYHGTSNTQIKPVIPRSWEGCGGLPAASGSPITPSSPLSIFPCR